MEDKQRGIVLKEVLIGESNKLLTILLKDYGKISISARGAKNVKSKFAPSANIFAYSDFIFLNKGNFKTIAHSDLIENFYNIRNSYENMVIASYIVELVEKNIPERLECNEILLLLLTALSTLNKDKLDNKLVQAIFELKFLQLLGYEPSLFNCVNCGSNKFESIYFNTQGILCSNCKNKYDIKIDENTLFTGQYIISSEIKKLFNFNVSKETINTLLTCNKMMLQEHVNYNLNTLKSLNMI